MFANWGLRHPTTALLLKPSPSKHANVETHFWNTPSFVSRVAGFKAYESFETNDVTLCLQMGGPLKHTSLFETHDASIGLANGGGGGGGGGANTPNPPAFFRRASLLKTHHASSVVSRARPAKHPMSEHCVLHPPPNPPSKLA